LTKRKLVTKRKEVRGVKRRFSHGEEEVRDDLPTEVRDERFRRQRRRRPKIRARSPLWVCPVASAALGHKIERRPLSVTRNPVGMVWYGMVWYGMVWFLK